MKGTRIAKLFGVTMIAATLALAPATAAFARKGVKPAKAQIHIVEAAARGTGAYYFDGSLGEFAIRRIKNAETTTTFQVSAGPYLIRQVDAPAPLLDIECDDERVEVRRRAVIVKAPPGADITCTFSN
ncbi:MAG: hypothetical protein WD757_07450 [Actinomycetota bacterium]